MVRNIWVHNVVKNLAHGTAADYITTSFVEVKDAIIIVLAIRGMGAATRFALSAR